jgi:FixJ family two-component response regulator
MELMIEGKANKVIAYDLDISQRTVEIHRARVMEKMGVRSLAHLVRMVMAAEENNS